MIFKFEKINEATIDQIIKKHKEIKNFWGKLSYHGEYMDEGWTPPENVVDLLDEVWFDAQISLSCRLRECFRNHSKDEHIGKLISLWVILGSLVENTLRFFLSVYKLDTEESKHKKYISFKNPRKTIATATFSEIIKFYKKEQIFDNHWEGWFDKIKNLRNSVHSFNQKEIYDPTELETHIIKYKFFVRGVYDRLPWP